MNTWSKSQLKNLWQHASTIPAPSQGYSIFEKSNRLIFIESRYWLQQTIRYRILSKLPSDSYESIAEQSNRLFSQCQSWVYSVASSDLATATLSTPHLPTLYLMLYSSSLPHLSQRNDSVLTSSLSFQKRTWEKRETLRKINFRIGNRISPLL